MDHRHRSGGGGQRGRRRARKPHHRRRCCARGGIGGGRVRGERRDIGGIWNVGDGALLQLRLNQEERPMRWGLDWSLEERSRWCSRVEAAVGEPDGPAVEVETAVSERF
ncbi:hypothetical protein Ancab_006785 [Ancistrocladus abbreviatus]